VGGGEHFLAHLVTAALVVAAFGALGWLAGALDLGGWLAGWLLGVAVWLGLGWRGFVLLAAFVVLGAAATRSGRARKRSRGIAQERGGRRGVRHALANGAVPGLAGFAVLACPGPIGASSAWAPVAARLIAAGAIAAATSDTLASEIGQAFGGDPRLVVGGRRVPPGTDGGVTTVGSLAGLSGAAMIGGLAWGLGLLGLAGAVAAVGAGFLGNLVDSLLGATLERRGLLGNEAVNLLASAAGGGLTLLLYRLF
jgi:uncharacterized protein (TIGR00297 family)